MQAKWVIQNNEVPESVEDVFDIVLKNRGVSRESFLGLGLHDLQKYMNIKNLDQGVELLISHLNKNSSITIVGDYDCDGITSVAQFSLFLREIGFKNFRVIIPTREEGYGIPDKALKGLIPGNLFITLDCGTHDSQKVKVIRENGLDVLIIDHHEIMDQSRVAPATVLINPKQPDCPSNFKEICSSGLTLLFLIRLRQMLPPRWHRPILDSRYQCLSAVGTIADVMPLKEANRIIAMAGLEKMEKDKYPPLSVLRRISGVSNKPVSAGIVGFYIAPRINAAGRVGDPILAFDLLTSSTGKQLEKTALELNRLNSKRQAEEEKVIKYISMYLKSCHLKSRTLVVAGKGWHPGVIGIVASRIIQDYHYGPTIVGSVDGNGVIKASGRSIPGFDMCAALSYCDDVLIKWGGHEAAAGMSVEVDRFSEFQKRFEEFAKQMPSEVFEPKLLIDTRLPLELISTDLVNQLLLLEPHGPGNPQPTFLTEKLPLQSFRTFGNKSEHLAMDFDPGISAVYWKGGNLAHELRVGNSYDVVYTIEMNYYNNRPKIIIKSIRPG